MVRAQALHVTGLETLNLLSDFFACVMFGKGKHHRVIWEAPQ